MTSEIKVDTISENTSANGVTIDGLTIKDGNIIGDVALAGTTPTFTIGDAGAEDAALIFDGNAQDFYVALDDSADDLVIGLGNTIGTTPIMSFDENKDVVIHDGGLTITTADNTDTLTLVSTDADANIGPNLRLYRNSSSPADGDQAGLIRFDARNDNSQDFTAANIFSFVDDASDGTEDGAMLMSIMLGGTARSRIWMGSATAETVFNDDSQDIDFRVESNSYAHCLFVDGGNDRVGVGENSDIGGLFRVSLGDSGVTGVDAGGQGLVIEDNASTGLTIATPNNAEGGIKFADPQDNDAGRINYDHSADAMFFMTSGNEQLRIDSSGHLNIGFTSFSATNTGLKLFADGQIYFVMNSSSSTNVVRFYNQATGNIGGNINMSGDSTSYNSGSDYRLKDNVNYSFDATTRLKQLKPARFNFINTPDTTVDGFLAHEAQTVVPESVTGVHNETETRNKVVVNSNGIIIADNIEEADWTAGKIADEDGNTIYPTNSTWEASKVVPVYQSIDHSKMVPLLVKTIQELEARITALEG